MSTTRFHPEGAVTFDLAHGLVHVEGAREGVLVPAEALVHLAKAAGPAAWAAFGAAIGGAMGARVASRLGDVRAASVELVVEHLAGELALAGLGALSLERWGQAMVLVVNHAPLGEAGDNLLEAALTGALEMATGAPAVATRLQRDGGRARFFVGSAAVAARLRALVDQGAMWGEALLRLHRRGDA
jgi:hypothetical protein